MNKAFVNIGLIRIALTFIQSIFFFFLNTNPPALCQEMIFEQFKENYFTNWITCMHQDSRGFIWIGTVNYLIRFDGNTVIVYEPTHGDTNSVSGNFIQCLMEDEAGTLWIGTLADGLNKYNRQTNKFTRFRHNPKNPNSLSDNCVKVLYQDRARNVWIGTNAGLDKLDRKKNQFTRYTRNRGKTSSDTDAINTIAEDEFGLLWIGTDRGLYLFDKVKSQFYSFKECFGIGEVFENKRISVLYPEESGVFWIGTTEGLFQFDRNSQKWRHFPTLTEKRYPVPSNQIQALCDMGHFLWLGTADGLYKFDKKSGLYTRYEHDLRQWTIHYCYSGCWDFVDHAGKSEMPLCVYQNSTGRAEWRRSR